MTKTITRKLEIIERAVITSFKQGAAAVELYTKLPDHPSILTRHLERKLETTTYFFISEAEIGNQDISIQTIEKLKKYYYLEPPLLSKFKKSFAVKASTDNQGKIWEEIQTQNSLNQFEDLNFSSKNLVRWDWNEGNIYNLDKDLPISRYYFISYTNIGGINNADYDLTKALKILRESRWASDIQEIKVPSYNADRYNKALEFKVCLPQDQFDEICNYWKNEVKDKYWTSRVKESLVGTEWQKFDPLGLRAARATKKEVCETCGHEQEDD